MSGENSDGVDSFEFLVQKQMRYLIRRYHADKEYAWKRDIARLCSDGEEGATKRLSTFQNIRSTSFLLLLVNVDTHWFLFPFVDLRGLRTHLINTRLPNSLAQARYSLRPIGGGSSELIQMRCCTWHFGQCKSSQKYRKGPPT